MYPSCTPLPSRWGVSLPHGNLRKDGYLDGVLEEWAGSERAKCYWSDTYVCASAKQRQAVWQYFSHVFKYVFK